MVGYFFIDDIMAGEATKGDNNYLSTRAIARRNELTFGGLDIKPYLFDLKLKPSCYIVDIYPTIDYDIV